MSAAIACPALSSRLSLEKTRPAMIRRCAAARVSTSPRSTSATSNRLFAATLFSLGVPASMPPMSTKLLDGERALVTGCGGGIGRGIAKALKAEGATVLGSDLKAPPDEDGIDFLEADLGQRDGWRTL